MKTVATRVKNFFNERVRFTQTPDNAVKNDAPEREKIRGADLTRIIREGRTDFTNVDLSRQILDFKDFSGMNLSGADLHGAKFYMTNLTRADLSEADLTVAYCNGEDQYSRACFNSANLHNAILNQAYFPHADFTGADFTGADLRKANLDYAILTGADFRGADLTKAELDHAILTGAIFDEHTKCEGIRLNGAIDIPPMLQQYAPYGHEGASSSSGEWQEFVKGGNRPSSVSGKPVGEMSGKILARKSDSEICLS